MTLEEDLKIGHWFFMCCEQDLFQIATEEDLEFARSWAEDVPSKGYLSKEDALEAIRLEKQGPITTVQVISGDHSADSTAYVSGVSYGVEGDTGIWQTIWIKARMLFDSTDSDKILLLASNAVSQPKDKEKYGKHWTGKEWVVNGD